MYSENVSQAMFYSNACTISWLSFPICAGEGPIYFDEACWSCSGDGCLFLGDMAMLKGSRNPQIATAEVSVPGGGQYRLLYRLKNDGGPPNFWQARISSVDNSFPATILESLKDRQSFDWTDRELSFSLPEGTTAISLTFKFRQVRQSPSNSPPTTTP